ncbi:Ppx/GppA phosphatase family protein [Paracoccaceae bacterium GXU_MW_L88]
MAPRGDGGHAELAQSSRRSRAQKKRVRTRYAALDLGTNSCRMLIAEPDGRGFKIIDAFSKSVRLGEDLERTGFIGRDAQNRTVQALHVCAGKLKRAGVTNQRLVATEACRRAKNGKGFLRRVQKETGLRLEVIRPQEEARLAVISCGSLVSPESEQVLVVDIGGGSTELVWVDLSHVAPEKRVKAMLKLRFSRRHVPGPNEARLVDWISVPLGVATLFERYKDVEDDGARFALMSWLFEEHVADFAPYEDGEERIGNGKFQIVGTSGTVTTVGAAHLGLTRYDRKLVDGMQMTGDEIDAVVREFLVLGPEGRRRDPRIGKDRVELIMSGAAILQTLLRLWPTDMLSVADRGLREGMLFSMMNAAGERK